MYSTDAYTPRLKYLFFRELSVKEAYLLLHGNLFRGERSIKATLDMLPSFDRFFCLTVLAPPPPPPPPQHPLVVFGAQIRNNKRFFLKFADFSKIRSCLKLKLERHTFPCCLGNHIFRGCMDENYPKI